MTRTTPKLAPPPNFHATPTGGRVATTYDFACNRLAPYTADLQRNRVFEPATLRSRGRDLSTRPPRPRKFGERGAFSSVVLVI
ncbi:hypothetical protein AVEN_266751-1 [Araneus ventricosus]|uniref:Uncharacterized protein n=1 Tax=Araneus ventricosus TaxID=182803 RepID=A0A4Y2TWP4_ARAVE|nr:hypothetical protein AVEN_266751-1 [Araneus ventricosus]